IYLIKAPDACREFNSTVLRGQIEANTKRNLDKVGIGRDAARMPATDPSCVNSSKHAGFNFNQGSHAIPVCASQTHRCSVLRQATVAHSPKLPTGSAANTDFIALK